MSQLQKLRYITLETAVRYLSKTAVRNTTTAETEVHNPKNCSKILEQNCSKKYHYCRN